MRRESSGSLVTMCVLAAILAGCASGGNGSAAGPAGCTLRPVDSVFAVGGPVYRDCAVERRARLVEAAEPDFRDPNSSGCVTTEIEFVVGADGVPESTTARIVQGPNAAYAMALIKVLPQWKYQPALIDGVPVRQIVELKRAMGTTVSGKVPFVVATTNERPGAGTSKRPGPPPRC